MQAKLAAAGLVLCSLRGCVVYEIRDQLEQSNRSLETSNARLDEIKGDLARTSAEMVEVKAQLASSSEALADVRQRLDVLASLDRSLQSIDASLKLVKGLIEQIPILGNRAKEGNP